MSSKSKSRKTQRAPETPCDLVDQIGWFDDIDPFDIKPLNRCNSRHLADLTEDIRENGWRGRQLLVLERGSEYIALTGSHRVLAAREAGLSSVPCYVLPEEELLKRGIDLDFEAVADYHRLKLLRQLGDETAYRLMWEENRS